VPLVRLSLDPAVAALAELVHEQENEAYAKENIGALRVALRTCLMTVGMEAFDRRMRAS
jgi:hypothetical protein